MAAEALKIATESSIVLVPFSVQAGGVEVSLALNVHKVLRVAEMEGATPLPSGFAPFVAVLELGGGAIPVLDLARILAPTAPPPPLAGRVVVCNVQGLVVGVLASRTRKIERHQSARVYPPPPTLRLGDTAPFAAAVERGGGHTYLLDLEAVLAAHGVGTTPEAPAELGRAALEGQRVLVVEDSRFFQARCAEILRKRGAHVDVENDGRAGLARLVATDFGYDLVVTDVEMPYMSGIEMVREARRHAPRPLRVLFNSGITNPALIAAVEADHLGSYLVKFSEPALIEAAVKALRAT